MVGAFQPLVVVRCVRHWWRVVAGTSLLGAFQLLVVVRCGRHWWRVVAGTAAPRETLLARVSNDQRCGAIGGWWSCAMEGDLCMQVDAVPVPLVACLGCVGVCAFVHVAPCVSGSEC